ncbi:hypothetical protein [Neisseria perflava]|uniref:hypothetical protein n=1 Tax=Neisseria perflava TaxID=33053 RepID=UPI0020A21D1A|nr:hypothetical protein [Neisseria perflava]MCP1659661.1 hypothetical protein [Neisseria perflava]MCP1771319.1 hypothetical protein [Neisseria perflava]
MKFSPVLLTAVLLAACGGADEQTPKKPADNAPKPVFLVKFISADVWRGLPLGAGQSSRGEDGKTRVRYPIVGLDGGQNMLEAVGNHRGDLEAVNGQCMETDRSGNSAGWPQEGICAKLFARLTANVAQEPDKISAYLIRHAALQPYHSGASGYAAVQNGRYILETDSSGAFSFRRRHY